MPHSIRHADLTPGVPQRAAHVKSGSQVLFDIVEYVVQNHDWINVSPAVRSADKYRKRVGFTLGIGKMTLFRMLQYRRYEHFRNKSRTIANNLRKEKSRHKVGQRIRRAIEYYSCLLTVKDPTTHFVFFAAICELCILLKQNADYVSKILKTAMVTMDKMQLTFPGWREMDVYAREVLQVCRLLQRLKGSKRLF